MGADVGQLRWVDGDARIVIAARATRSFAQSAIAVLIAIYLGLQGFSLVEVGTFLTIGSVGAALAAVAAGVLGDAVGRRRTLVILSLLTALSGITLVVSERFVVLAMAAFVGNLSGFVGAGGLGPLEQAVLAASASPRRRTDLFALFNIAGTIAGALGALASGFPTLLQRSLGLGELASFHPCFVAYAGLAVLAALLYSRLSCRVEVPSGEARWTNPFTLPSRSRIFTLVGLFATDSFGTGLIVQSLAAYWLFVRFGLQPGHLGALFFTSSVLTAISLWAAARLAGGIGLLNTMVFTHIPSSLFLMAVPFVPEAWMAVALWLLRAFFVQMDVPTSQSCTMAVVARAERTALASATTVSRSIGIAAESPFVSQLAEFPPAVAALWHHPALYHRRGGDRRGRSPTGALFTPIPCPDCPAALRHACVLTRHLGTRERLPLGARSRIFPALDSEEGCNGALDHQRPAYGSQRKSQHASAVGHP